MTIKAIYKPVPCETVAGLGRHITKGNNVFLHVG